MEKIPQSKCPRKELKCKLYREILKLEKSLDSETGHKPKSVYEDRRLINTTQHWMSKKPGCTCPPGCCKESLELKPVDLSKLTGQKNTSGVSSNHPTSTLPPNPSPHTLGHLPWHRTNHNDGCFPGHDHSYQNHPLTGPTQRDQGGSDSLQAPLDFTPEECLQRGCFIARAA